MSFQQALSGLNASSSQLSAIGNNIANSNTVGFKQAQVQFADSYAASLQGGGAAPIGIGTRVGNVAQQFTQGNLTTTGNSLDLAVNGAGMFRMDNNGILSYTRNGQFLVDKDGYVINSNGLKLTGYGVNTTTNSITPGALQPLQMNNSAIPPQVTTTSAMMANLDSRTTPPTSLTHGKSVASLAPNVAAGTGVVTLATNDTFELSIDSYPAVLVTIPPATYTNAALATAMQTAVTTALTTAATAAGTVPVPTATVTLNAAGLIEIASGSVGTVGYQGLGSSAIINPAGTSVLLGAAATNGYTEFFEGAVAGGGTTTTSGTDVFKTTDTNSFTSSTAQTVYDTLGNAHTMSMYFVKTSQPGHWQFYTGLDGAEPALMANTSAHNINNVPPAVLPALPPAAPAVPEWTDLTFSSTGVLTTPASGVTLTQTFPVSTGATTPLTFSLDLTGTTQYGIAFGTNQLTQDGYTSGKLAGLSVSSDGLVQGRYSNGKTRNMGQVVLANFNNPNGLQSLGENQWGETTDAGSPIPGAPGTGTLGLLQSGTVEDSNVDMTAELVNMITAQRSYQANAQTIKTMDQIMQTLVNLR